MTDFQEPNSREWSSTVELRPRTQLQSRRWEMISRLSESCCGHIWYLSKCWWSKMPPVTIHQLSQLCLKLRVWRTSTIEEGVNIIYSKLMIIRAWVNGHYLNGEPRKNPTNTPEEEHKAHSLLVQYPCRPHFVRQLSKLRDSVKCQTVHYILPPALHRYCRLLSNMLILTNDNVNNEFGFWRWSRLIVHPPGTS